MSATFTVYYTQVFEMEIDADSLNEAKDKAFLKVRDMSEHDGEEYEVVDVVELK
jgi:hypothetical protein